MEPSNSGILLASGTNEVEFMEFLLGGVSYGVNVAKVVRVVSLKDTPITAVADVRPGVLGVIYDHGKPLKLIDLRQALGLPEPDRPNERRLVLIAHFNRQSTAYLIDGVHKIHRTTWDNFEPLSPHLAGEGFITGTSRLEDRIVLILDLERLLLEFTPQKPVRVPSTTGADDAEESAARRGRAQIVFAEDSALIRRLTSETLRQAGYTHLSVFDNGQDALEHVLRRRQDEDPALPPVDLVLTDIEMPKLDGLTFCKRMKEADAPRPAPPVVVYSSLINDDLLKKCKAVGTDRELSKPAVDEIVKAIDELIVAGR